MIVLLHGIIKKICILIFIFKKKTEKRKMQLLYQINMTGSGTRLTDKTKSNQGLLTHYTDNIWS